MRLGKGVLAFFVALRCVGANLSKNRSRKQLRDLKSTFGGDNYCTIVALSDALVNVDEHYDVTSFSCVTESSNYFYPIKLANTEEEYMTGLLDSGSIISNESTLIIDEDISFDGHTITSTGTHHPNFQTRNTSPRRRLEEGNKPILAVKVTDINGLAHSDSAAMIGDNIFGTNNDLVNLKSQMAACSFGQLNIVTEYTEDISGHEAAPGVIEVTIPIGLTVNDRYAIHNAITTAVQTKLGFNLPGPFEQVMYVIEKCYVGCGWAAYAYVNSWMSVYQGDNYKQVAVQMHEIGHNFGFSHSGGLDGQTYTDHTCLMGNPLYGDDVGRMCFNPAKNWAIGWYDSRKIEVDISQNYLSHNETIIGIADFDNNPQERNVIIKLETGTSYDYFVGFNRAIGVNSENDAADDEVTIILTSHNVAYSQSYLQATLQEGESWTINGVTLTAEEIDISTNPGTARVSIMKGETLAPFEMYADGEGGGVCAPGKAVTQGECFDAVHEVGVGMTLGDILYSHNWDWTPCGCFIYNDSVVAYNPKDPANGGCLAPTSCNLVCRKIATTLAPTPVSTTLAPTPVPTAAPTTTLTPTIDSDFEMKARGEGGGICESGKAVTQGECLDAALKVGVGMTLYGILNVGDWNFTPCGCFIYNEYYVDYKDPSYGNCLSSNMSNLVCRKRAATLSPTAAPTTASDFELKASGEGEGICASGKAVTKEECSYVALEVGVGMTLNPDLIAKNWNWTPCGCFIYNESYAAYKDPAYGSCLAHDDCNLACRKKAVTLAPTSIPTLAPTAAPTTDSDFEMYADGEGGGVCASGKAVTKEECSYVALEVGVGMTLGTTLYSQNWNWSPCGCFIFKDRIIAYKDPEYGGCLADNVSKLVCRKDVLAITQRVSSIMEAKPLTSDFEMNTDG